MGIAGRKPIGTIAYMGGVHAMPREFTHSWGQLIQYNCEFLETPTGYIHYDKVDYSDHAPARNHLAGTFLGDWLLMLDTDHEFEPDLLERMLHRAEAYEVDVLAGFYQLKKPPHFPVVWIWDEEHRPRPIAKWDPQAKIIQIAAAGAGALWVRRKVFDRIRTDLKEEPFIRLPGGLSEDHSFFHRLDKLGIPAWCDPRIQVPHLYTRGITQDDLDLTAVSCCDVPLAGFG